VFSLIKGFLFLFHAFETKKKLFSPLPTQILENKKTKNRKKAFSQLFVKKMKTFPQTKKALRTLHQ